MSVADRLRAVAQDVREDVSNNGGVEVEFDGRTVGVLILTSVLLTLFYYYARPGFFRTHFEDDLIGMLGLAKSSWKGILHTGTGHSRA